MLVCAGAAAELAKLIEEQATAVRAAKDSGTVDKSDITKMIHELKRRKAALAALTGEPSPDLGRHCGIFFLKRAAVLLCSWFFFWGAWGSGVGWLTTGVKRCSFGW